ncbi:MAG: hypothetical protein F4X99_10535 [Gammaproteobacteria bacterium]|nr:hypothetical protein [Gammaproteobacteria bacterium]
MREQQDEVPDATEQAADDQRALAPEQVRQVAGGHLEHQDQAGEPGLQQQDLGKPESPALEEEHDDRHQHHEHLQERERERPAYVACQLSGRWR